jgi:hypothetical protein
MHSTKGHAWAPTTLVRRSCAVALLLGSSLATQDAAAVDSTAPLRTSPGLTSITVFERTGGTAPVAYTFSINSLQLTSRRSDPLSSFNSDISTAASESYDIYYSNADGAFNVDGGFLTIEAVYSGTAPTNAGLNVAEVRLNFSDGTSQFAGGIASFLRLGTNGSAVRVQSAVDGNLLTHTAMGNTFGQSSRLRLTVSFHERLPVRDRTGVLSVTLYERTGGAAPDEYAFSIGSSAVLNRLPDRLGSGNNDFVTLAQEYYDIYLSDASGNFDPLGAFVTVEAVSDRALPSSGGLNLAEVRLNFADGTSRRANGVASFASLGDNAAPDLVARAVDVDLQTQTTMGNTVGLTQRLRVTVGF